MPSEFKKEIMQVNGRLVLVFNSEETEKYNLAPGKIINMDDCIIEEIPQKKCRYLCVGCRQIHYDEDYSEEDGDMLITEEQSYNLDKVLIAALEGEFAPGRIKQGIGILFIQ